MAEDQYKKGRSREQYLLELLTSEIEELDRDVRIAGWTHWGLIVVFALLIWKLITIVGTGKLAWAPTLALAMSLGVAFQVLHPVPIPGTGKTTTRWDSEITFMCLTDVLSNRRRVLLGIAVQLGVWTFAALYWPISQRLPIAIPLLVYLGFLLLLLLFLPLVVRFLPVVPNSPHQRMSPLSKGFTILFHALGLAGVAIIVLQVVASGIAEVPEWSAALLLFAIIELFIILQKIESGSQIRKELSLIRQRFLLGKLPYEEAKERANLVITGLTLRHALKVPLEELIEVDSSRKDALNQALDKVRALREEVKLSKENFTEARRAAVNSLITTLNRDVQNIKLHTNRLKILMRKLSVSCYFLLSAFPECQGPINEFLRMVNEALEEGNKRAEELDSELEMLMDGLKESS